MFRTDTNSNNLFKSLDRIIIVVIVSFSVSILLFVFCFGTTYYLTPMTAIARVPKLYLT